MSRRRARRPERPHGAALLLALMLMAALSLLALAAASDALVQERLTRNLQQGQRAMAAADSGLDWAEDWLMSLQGDSRPLPCASACGAQEVIRAEGQYPAMPEHEPPTWWRAAGAADGADPLNGRVLAVRAPLAMEPARWIVEELHYRPADGAAGTHATSYYRIIARGAAAGATAVVLESIIARPWGGADWADPFPARTGEAGFCDSLAIDDPCGRLAWRQR